jgi:hypothetical protein
MPVISAFWRLRQEDCKFEANTDYTVSARPAYVHSEKLSQKKKKKIKQINQTNQQTKQKEKKKDCKMKMKENLIKNNQLEPGVSGSCL